MRQSAVSSHAVQFYEADAGLLPGLTRYVLDGLDAGETVVVYASPQHREWLEVRLVAGGVDLADARSRGRYLDFDAAETLASFITGGVPDEALFAEVIGATVGRLARAGTVRAFGEMVALLVAEGSSEGALRLEELWNDLQRAHPFTLLCAYPMNLVDNEGLFDGVCARHSSVIPAEDYLDLSEQDRHQHVAALQRQVRHLQREVSELRSEAAAALKVRDEFLMTAAHELRTPLTSVLASLQILDRRLQQGPVQREQAAEVLRLATDGARRLSQLARQFLDTTRLSTGRVRLELTRVDIAGLTREAVAAAARGSSKHTLRLDAPDSLFIDGDPLRLEQVVANLLDNAVRFSPEGCVIETRLSAGVHDGRHHAELVVRDHGPGIATPARGRIFDRFFQGNGETRGLGLGLHLSRQLVDAHGGTIEANFPSDGGTQITVRIPMTANA